MQGIVRRATVLTVAASAALAPAVQPAQAAEEQSYIVLYRQEKVPGDAGLAVGRAGGTLVAAYDQIGVVIARSSEASFDERLEKDSRIEAAASTAGFGVTLDEVETADAEGPPEGNLPNAPASDTDTFSPLQWDMRQIHTPEAHAITGGSPAVVVGDIDTGVDKDHPDLVANIDFSKSASCESGAPDQSPAAWDDRHGHGTHTTGTMAAAANGFGIVGVAPRVKIAAIKSSTDEGFFFPEMVVCAFMWAGMQHVDVANNSYFADPFLFNCRNDAEQRAIWKAEQRAIRFAMHEGVTVVASAGNDSSDRSHPTFDPISPDFPPGSAEEREITNACVVIPLEISGVIGVSAVGNMQQADEEEGPDYLKSFYSSYGVSAVDLTAPGGDSIFGMTAEAPNGRVLSTWPQEIPCARSETDPAPFPTGSTYCYAQGTSMAAPHVSGVAALIISRYGDSSTPQNGHMRPNQVEAFLQNTADPQPCPSALPPGYDAFTQLDGTPQECQGGSGHNGWYGKGQVNALSAVMR